MRAELAELLRARGHDAMRASEVGQVRADDALILERATEGLGLFGPHGWLNVHGDLLHSHAIKPLRIARTFIDQHFGGPVALDLMQPYPLRSA